MPENQQVFDQAMIAGDSAAWDQLWDKAIGAYARAVQESPANPKGYNSLGYALLQAKRYPDALRVYSRARQLDPNDPLPLEKSADVLERLGRLKEAAEQYIAVADVYIGQHQDVDKAIGNWERATLLTPGLLQIHFRLAQAYERTGKKRAAVLQYLTMAFYFQRNSDRTKALQSIERALRLEPANAQVLNAKRAIDSSEFIMLPRLDDDTRRSEDAPFADVEDKTNEDGPIGEATEGALAGLAEWVMSGDLSPAITQAIRGIELFKIQEWDAAVAAFQKAETQGLSYPTLYLLIGVSLLKLARWQDSEKYLLRAQASGEYLAGIQQGLGLAATGLKKTRAASEYLIKSLESVDVGLAMHEDEAGEIKAVYNALRSEIGGMQDADLADLNNELAKYLTGKAWRVQIQETRRALNERLRSGDTRLSELIKNRDVIETVTKIDRYMSNNMYRLAMDEAHHAIEKSPSALAVHQRVAQTLMEEGKIQDAIVKFNLVAQVYLARDDNASAAGILYEVIKIAPTDVNLRTTLIELLERQEKWDEILTEYIGLGHAYHELADMESARNTYNEANRLAQRLNAPIAKRAEILTRMAEIDMYRLDLRQAQRTYEQIRQLQPEDDGARKALIDIYHRLNNAIEATKELDSLLRLYAQNKRGDQILATLESLVAGRPQDLGLRSRMAAVYRQVGRKQDAITQLDALGELQLEAGLYQDACATIKLIISLSSGDTEQYKTLLQQLGC